MEVVHEKDIPRIAGSTATSSVTKQIYTELSFAVATSLAAVKRMTWEQTPWLNAHLEASQCAQIAELVSLYTGQDISAEVIHSALLFGETYAKDTHERNLGTYPQLLVVFPHIQQDVSRNPEFMRVWHDEFVRPAFDRAWEESGLVTMFGASTSFLSKITNRVGGGLFHNKMARPVVGFLDHLRNDRKHRAHTHWPEWHDFWGDGHEGKFSDKRAKVFDDAWKSIKGMLTNYPGMEAFQDPVLLLVNHGRVDFNSNATRNSMFDIVGDRWDKYIDSRFVVRDSFKVIIENIVGGPWPDKKQANDEEGESGPAGVQSKRLAEIQNEAQGGKGEPAAKRRRLDWYPDKK